MWGLTVDVFRAVTLSPWWHNIIAYLGITWALTIVFMRYGPRECPKLKTQRISGAWNEPDKWVVRHYTRDECVRKNHLFHVVLRDWAVVYAVFWPFWAIAALPILLVVAGINLTGMLGQPKWWETKRNEKLRLQELLEKSEHEEAR